MSSPFFVVDHKVGPRAPLPYEDRPPARRSQPEPLRLSLPPPGVPYVLTPPAVAPAPASEARAARGGWLARLWRRPQSSPA